MSLAAILVGVIVILLFFVPRSLFLGEGVVRVAVSRRATSR
jgi:hypothetical protein